MPTLAIEPSAFEATLTPIGDPRAIEADWRALEHRAQPSFFQTWDWIGTFLASVSFQVAPQVLRVSHAGCLAGLAVLWRTTRHRRGFVRSRTLHLSETGDAQFDRVTLEHNGLLAARGLEPQVVAAALGHLASIKEWDEIELSGLREADHASWRAATSAHGLGLRTQWEKPYFYVDLERIRAAKTTYLDSLSANTRYQIRRAMRLYADRGPLRCEHASSLPEALEWLSQLARLHQAQWTARGQPGAFGSEFTVLFHEQLVSTAWSKGRVILTRLSAGDSVLGYLYNFSRDGVTYNYQSGHVAEDDPKLKPGLVCHALAVEDALQRSASIYDLLMGGEHFKSSLVNASGRLFWDTVQRRRIAFRVEDLLRQGYRRLRSRSSASAATEAPRRTTGSL